MADQAKIGSIDDIARFRAQLITFLSGARVAVEECSIDVGRMQSWLELDRRRYWEAEAWKRQRKLEEAKQSLFQDSLQSQTGPSSWHQMQVHRAERSLELAKEKLAKIKAWSRSFQNRALPMVKQVEQLHSVLTIDMARALNFLTQSLDVLDAYAARRPGATASAGADAGAPSDGAVPAPGENPPPSAGLSPVAAAEQGTAPPDGGSNSSSTSDSNPNPDSNPTA